MKTKNVFRTLAIFMIGFGIAMGIVFPFFVGAATGASKELIYTPLFFFLCISAGFLVGLFNIFLAKKIVGEKTRQLSKHMKYVEGKISEKSKNGDFVDCSDEKCFIKEITDDEIGQSAKSFNSLVRALSDALRLEVSVRNFTEILSSRLDLNQLAEEALAKLIESMNCLGGAIIIDQGGNLTVISSYGITDTQTMVKNQMIANIFKNGERLIINLPEDILLDGVLIGFKPKTVLAEPIVYKGVVLGVAVLAGMDEFTADMKNDMKMFGQGLALAFKNAITHDQLQKLAANDPLTGVYNRRFGMSRLKEEFARSVMTNQPLGLVMLDIDHFKRINDTYGHLVGDKVLVMVSNTVKSALREGDILLRYGGEEFIAVLPGASVSDVKQISERIRRFIEDSVLQYSDSRQIHVTVSSGGTSFPEYGAQDMNGLIDFADTNLYQAKAGGRNRCVVQ